MKNDYEIRGDITAIFVNSKNHGLMETVISTRQLEKVSQFTGSWYVDWCKKRDYFRVQGSVWESGKTKMHRLHRWVTDAPPKLMVDHIDRDPLNNTDENLRLVTNVQNKQNLRLTKVNKSGVRGVHWSSDTKKWVAQCSSGGRTFHVGSFNDIADAEEAVREARMKYMPYSNEIGKDVS